MSLIASCPFINGNSKLRVERRLRSRFFTEGVFHKRFGKSPRRLLIAAIALFASAHAHREVEAAAHASPLEIHNWINQLSTEDWILQSVAMKELGERKVEKAVPAIRRIFEKKDNSWLRGQAMLALAKILGKEMSTVANTLVQDKDPVLRKASLRTLDLVGGETSAQMAKELLQDPVEEVRAMAAALYANKFPEEAWPTVEKLTRLENNNVPEDLLRALAHIGSSNALARIEALSNKSDAQGNMRHKIIRALGVTGEEGTALLTNLTVRHHPKTKEFQTGLKQLHARNKTTISSLLMEVLGGNENELRGNAAILTSEICPTHSMGDFLADSWKKRPSLPENIVRSGLIALSKIDPARYKSFFTHYLTSDNPETRSMAIRCRSLTPDGQMFDVFRKYVHDKESEVAQAALQSLHKSPKDSYPAEGLLAYLEKSFESSDKKVALNALGLFGKRGKIEEFDKGLKSLEQFLEKEEPQSREAAAKALEQIGKGSRFAEIASAQGFIGNWQIVGPFMNDNRDGGFAKLFPPEEKNDAQTYKTEYKWEFGGGQGQREIDVAWISAPVENVGGEIHVAAQMPFPIKHAVAYAKAEIVSDADRIVRMALVTRERTSQKVWVNDDLLATYTLQHNELGGTHHQRMAEEPKRTEFITTKLKRGINKILVKTSTFGGNWWLRMRILHEKENECAKGLKVLLPKKEVE